MGWQRCSETLPTPCTMQVNLNDVNSGVGSGLVGSPSTPPPRVKRRLRSRSDLSQREIRTARHGRGRMDRCGS